MVYTICLPLKRKCLPRKCNTSLGPRTLCEKYTFDFVLEKYSLDHSKKIIILPFFITRIFAAYGFWTLVHVGPESFGRGKD